jgi:hypothetical protein
VRAPPDRTAITERTVAHLVGLCQTVGDVAEGVIAPAVYCHQTAGGDSVLVPAEQNGYEGVACLDDAARLLVLLLTADPVHLRVIGTVRRRQSIIASLLAFVLKMQVEGDRFANFILDWTGSVNADGPTSEAGGNWWTARALRALAWASKFGHSPTAKRSFLAALPRLSFGDRWDEESHLIWACLDFDALHDVRCALSATPWVERLVAETDDLPFGDGPLAKGVPHLWGRSQELVVARVAQRIRNREWLSLAQESCHEFLRPLAVSGFRGQTVTLPYEVSSVVRNLRTVAAITGDRELFAAAAQASGWFWGANRGDVLMIDTASGRAFDGLDDRRPSQNSGAEANIEALFTIASQAPTNLIYV